MTETLRTAVVGVGHMGRHHARIYRDTPGCELVAVVDPNLERAKAATQEYGGQAFASVSDLTVEVDAATVAVPTVYHAEVAIPLMQRGVNVLVEKPLAQDTQSAKQLLDASIQHRCLLQVGHSERFNPVVQALIRLNVTPQFVETNRVSPFTFRSADIGVVFDMMIHDIDIVLHLVNEREYEVDAVGVNVLGSCEDVANARVRFANGSVANLTASRLALKTERRIRVFAPTAYLSMDYQKKSGIAIKVDDNLDLIRMAKERDFEDLSQMADLDYGSMIKIEPLQVDDTEPLRAEIESFLHSIRHNEAAAVSADDGYQAVEMAERITKAVQEQGWSEDLARIVDG